MSVKYKIDFQNNPANVFYSGELVSGTVHLFYFSGTVRINIHFKLICRRNRRRRSSSVIPLPYQIQSMRGAWCSKTRKKQKMKNLQLDLPLLSHSIWMTMRNFGEVFCRSS